MLLAKVTQLAAAIEANAGTAETLDATDATFNAENVEVQPNIPFVERQLAGSMSPGKGVPGSRAGRVTVDVDFIGGASAPAWMSIFLPCCGWVAQTGGIFAPRSEAPGSSVKTCTIGWYENGRRKLLHGCMGTWEATWVSGMPMKIRFDMTGLWNAPADATILAPTRETALPLRFASSGLLLAGAHTPVARQLVLRAGNQIKLVGDSTTASGFKHAVITGRRMTGTLNPEANLVATKDYHAEMLASTEQALALAVGSTGNKVTMAAPKLQVTNVQYADEEGTIIDALEFQLNRSADTGDDEFTFAHS